MRLHPTFSPLVYPTYMVRTVNLRYYHYYHHRKKRIRAFAHGAPLLYNIVLLFINRSVIREMISFQYAHL